MVGPELIQFYNDGYRPSIRGDKHPGALGQRGVDCWPEIWHIIGPQIEAVMANGDSTWNLNQLVPIKRDKKLEEVYWTYSYSPVRDSDGKVQGTLVVCSDTTEQVLSERRLRTVLKIVSREDSKQAVSGADSVRELGQQILTTLHSNPEDIPFAALFFLAREEATLVGKTECVDDDIFQPAFWPELKTLHPDTPAVADLVKRNDRLVCEPWPEPVTSAYLLPLRMPEVSLRATLILGISPRLPFDDRYVTFFQLAGARIASLLLSKIQRMELEESAQRFSRLAEANPFGMVIGDLTGGLRYVNPVLLKTLGYSRAEVLAGSVRWDNLTPPKFADADAHALAQLNESGRCEVYEKEYVDKNGIPVPILIGASTIEHVGGGTEVAAFVTDLTSLKRAEEALRLANSELEKKVAERTAALEAEVIERQRAETSLRQLTGRLLITQDEERRHMARELHDHAGQTLVALDLNFAMLEELMKNQDAATLKLLTQSRKLSDEFSREIRTLSYLLHPPLLDEAGLESALLWFVEGFSERSRIEVKMDFPQQFKRLPNELELVIFRVVQEALTNVHRHSGSASAAIRLTRTQHEVEFSITDDGQGIPPEKQLGLNAARTGVGVRGMKERVRQFGGTLEITSSPSGTVVAGKIPVGLSTPPK